MTHWKLAKIVLLMALPVLMTWGCSSTRIITEELPPVVDLHAYRTIGVFDIEVSNQSAPLQRDATRKLIATLQNSQPGTRLLELGSEGQALAALGKSRLDTAAVKEICGRNGVEALIAGQMEVSPLNPSLKLGEALTSLSAKAVVHASLAVKLYEMPSGASLWSDVVSGKWTIAGFNLSESSLSDFQMKDPNEQYGKMVSDLVNAVTKSFRPTYRQRRVPR